MQVLPSWLVYHRLAFSLQIFTSKFFMGSPLPNLEPFNMASQSCLPPKDAPFSPLSIPAPHTALLLDFQNAFINHAGPTATAALARATSLHAWAQQTNIPIILATAHNGQPPPRTARLSPRAAQLIQAFDADPTLAQVHPHLRTAGIEQHTVVKRRLGLVSALQSDGIAALFKAWGTRSVILAGLSTSGCVLSTARAASDAGFVVTVVRDACADSRPGVHDCLVDVLEATAWVVSEAELREAWAIDRGYKP